MQPQILIDLMIFNKTRQLFPLQILRSTSIEKPLVTKGFENSRESENEGAMGEVKNDQCLLGYGVYYAMQVIV